MTENSIFEPAGRAVPYVEEGEGPVSLVLVSDSGPHGDALGVVAHYLAEEAGFRVVRIGSRAGAAVTPGERAQDVAAVMDHIGLQDSWIGGYGSGSTVARVFTLEHADRSHGLLLLGVEQAEVPLAPAIPVLIVQAADDDVTPPANADRVQASAPERASIKVIDGAGHLFPMTHAIETAVIIEEYLDWD